MLFEAIKLLKINPLGEKPKQITINQQIMVSRGPQPAIFNTSHQK